MSRNELKNSVFSARAIRSLRGFFAVTALVFAPGVTAQSERLSANPFEDAAVPRGDGKADVGPSVPAGKSPSTKKSRLTSDETEALADRRALNLTVGTDRTVDLDFDATLRSDGISIGNPSVLVTQLVRVGDKKQILFKPLKFGTTSVAVRDADGNLQLIFDVFVEGNPLDRIANEIKTLIRDVEGIEIRVVGQKVILEGEVLVPSDYARLLAVVQDKAYSDIVLNLVTFSSVALQVIAKRIQDDVSVFAPNVKTRVVNGVIFLEGNADNYDQARRAYKVAQFYLPEFKISSPVEQRDPSAQRLKRNPIENFILVSQPPPKKQEKLIRLTIHFVQLSKDYNRIFGFKWSPGFTSDPQIAVGPSATGSIATSGGSTFAATISSLIPKLQSAQSSGYARIIKSGTVIVRSGQPASLSERTSFPFLQVAPNGQLAAGSQQVGIDFGVTPQILGQSEDISLDVKLNQASLVGRAPTSNTSNPAITSEHKVETKLYVKSNESAAIAGVNSSDVGTDFNKDEPGAKSAQTGDPIFNLVRSKAYRKQRGQFVVFVTPQIIENASDGTEDLKRNFRIKAR